MKTFIKYPNRKIYNKSTAGYCNISYLLKLHKAGEEFQVIEHTSGRDCTRLVIQLAIANEIILAAKAEYLRESFMEDSKTA